MLLGLQDKQDKAFAAHIEDLFSIAQQRHTTRFSGFLDMHQHALAKQIAAAGGYDNLLFWGGHDEGERVMLGVFGPYEQPEREAFPMTALSVHFRVQDTLGHRDLLGALLALEIRREAVGDILLEPGRAVLFVSDKLAPLILGELEKVGRHGVRIEEGYTLPLPALHTYQDLPVNIPSLRLDCMVAALTNLSREKASGLIRAGQVSVNGAEQTALSRQLSEGDVLSLRGYGKFLFANVAYTTKKGRLQALCKKYI